LIWTIILLGRDAIKFKATLIYFASCFFKFNITRFTNTSQSHSLYLDRSLRSNLKFNASKELRFTTKQEKSNQFQRKWLITQDKKIQKGKKLRSQNWAKRRKRFNELFVLNLELSKALDMKECMLKMQEMILGKLAIKENYLKRLIEILNQLIANFDN